MTEQFKGGNSRLLARLLDQYNLPMAVLDRRGELVFVNAALCQLAAVEATSLVGKRCSWQVADDGPLAAILTACAPPASALAGRAVVRNLLTPIVFGSTATGQLFVPIVDDSGVVEWTLVVLGNIEHLQQFTAREASAPLGSQADRTLVQLRSRWKHLDHLHALIGDSPSIALALQRTQLARHSDCSVLLVGPGGVGKHDVATGIFLQRLKLAGLNSSLGQCFPIDCRKLDAELVDSMLEIFAGRVRHDLQRSAQQLILTGIDRLAETALERTLKWLAQLQEHATVVATSGTAASDLARRGPGWRMLISRLATVEIHLPGLADRRQDIGPLATHLLAEACQLADRAQLTLSGDALNLLEAFSWPDNVRQLRSAIRDAVRSAVLSSAILPNHLPVAVRTYASAATVDASGSVEPIDLDAVLVDLEKVMIRRALKLSPRNRAQAARLLGISRPRLLRRIEQLGLGDAGPVNWVDEDDQDDSKG